MLSKIDNNTIFLGIIVPLIVILVGKKLYNTVKYRNSPSKYDIYMKIINIMDSYSNI